MKKIWIRARLLISESHFSPDMSYHSVKMKLTLACLSLMAPGPELNVQLTLVCGRRRRW